MRLLLHSHDTFVQEAVYRGSNGQSTTDNSTDTSQKVGKGLGAVFTVDDLHGGDVVVEENTRDTTLRMDTFLVTLGGIVTTGDRSLVRCYRVLMRFNTAGWAVCGAVQSQGRARVVLVDVVGALGVPSQGQVRGRNNLDEVHEVVSGLVAHLGHSIQRVGVVVVGPLPALRDLVRKLRPESELVDGVAHGVFVIAFQASVEICLQVMGMNISARERTAGRDVEVANHLVHTNVTLNAATLSALCINLVRVPFSETLFDIFALAKSPLLRGICVSDFTASVAASWLFRTLWRRCSSTFTTVIGVQVYGDFVLVVSGDIEQSVSIKTQKTTSRPHSQFKFLNVDVSATFSSRAQAHLVHTVGNSHLLLARNVHDV